MEEHIPYVSRASWPAIARNCCSHRRQCQREAYSYKMKRKSVLFSQDNTEVELHCSHPACSHRGSKGFAVIQSQGEMLHCKVQVKHKVRKSDLQVDVLNPYTFTCNVHPQDSECQSCPVLLYAYKKVSSGKTFQFREKNHTNQDGK